jgi:disulfide bond formation protein DsbB
MKRFLLLATLGSASVLLGAFAFQHLGGMPPCKLCLWQRWPHAAAVLIGMIILLTGEIRLAWLGAIASLSTAGIGLYHVGVEKSWWEGPTSCTSSGVSNISAEDLLSQILSAPLVRCDDIAWQMAGISMAGWNALLSLGLAAIWVMAARRT